MQYRKQSLRYAEGMRMKKSLFTFPFITITILSGLMTVCLQMTVSAMPLFVVDMGVAKSLAGSATTACTLASLFFRPFAAEITDRAGGKKSAITGTLIYTVVFISYQFCSKIGFLLILRILQGIGMSLITTALGTVATAMVPKDQITKGMSYFSLGNAAALSIGPAVGLWIVQNYSFSALFTFGAAVTILTFAMLLIIRTDSVQETDLRQEADARREKTPVREESGRAEKEKNFFQRAKESGAIFPSALMALMILCQTSLSTYLSFFTGSLSIGGASTFFSLNVFGMIVSKFILGKACSAFGENKVAAVCGCLLTLAYGLIAAAGVTGEPGIYLAGLMYGFGYGGFYTLLNVAAVRGTNAGNRGVANSIFFGSKDVGTAVGSLVWGAIMMLGYPVMYGIAALVILLLAVLYIYLGEQNREEKIKGACLKAGASER